MMYSGIEILSWSNTNSSLQSPVLGQWTAIDKTSEPGWKSLSIEFYCRVDLCGPDLTTSAPTGNNHAQHMSNKLHYWF